MTHVRRQEAQDENQDHKKLPEIYRESAKLFFEAGYPLKASKYLEDAGLFEEAANMWVTQGQPDKAAPLYERAGQYSKASKIYHHAAMYTEATKSLHTGELYEELVQYLETVKNDLEPTQYRRSSWLCNLLAHKGKLEPSYKSRTLMLLGSDLRIEMFYHQQGYMSGLLEFFRSRGRLRDAFQYLISIGKIEQAVLLAPFEEMKASIPIGELNRVQQMLLISDLRSTQATHRPAYADPTHPHARPGMDELWDALYRDLMLKVLITTADAGQQVDGDIEGFAESRRFLDIIVLERMDDTVPRASEIMELPIQSVNYGLDLLRDLYYEKQEVPDVLRRFIGAYPQLNRSSFFLHSTSLVNMGGNIYRQISQGKLLKFSKEWFANLVMKATFSCLDSALMMWNEIRSGVHCVIYSATNQCDQIHCPYVHYIITSKAHHKLCNIIHYLALITSKLRFFYASSLRDFIEDGLLKDFRGKQRRWLEATLTELTYISAVQQDPRAIQDAPVFHTHEEKHKIYRWLRDDLEKLIVNIHAAEEWDSRNTFSELLELTQHSRQLGPYTAKSVGLLIRKQIHNTRQRGLGRARRTGLDLFLNRPSADPGLQATYDLPTLMTYFNEITRLHPAQLTAFHAVICEYERIATYLLLLDGSRSGFFILTSWITIYIPEISVAYRTYCHQFASIGPALQQQKQEIRASLLSLVHSLLDLAVKLFAPGDQMLFKLGGPRSIPLPTDLLLRRCLDVVWICLINIQAADHESQGPDPWPLSGPLIERLKQILPWLSNGLEIHLSLYPTNQALLKILNDSFTVYADKESITFVQTLPDVPRFSQYWPVIQECSIPVVPFATIDPSSNCENSNAQGQSKQIFTPEHVKAAEVICRICKEYWPLYKKAKEWKSTPLGQSTIAINELCESYRLELRGVPGVVEDLYMVFWEQGPKTHQAVAAAEAQGFETAERYQEFFVSLYGTAYTEEDLELVEESFKEVERYTGKVAEMKTAFSLEGMRKLWLKYQALGPLATGSFKRDMVTIQREATSIKYALVGLGSNKYVGIYG